MALVKVSITNRQKKVKLPSGLRLLVRRACNAVLTAEKFAGPAEVSVTFVDNEQIQELNAEYRGKDISTDVLSFPLGENGKFDKNRETGAYVLGDVVISAEKAVLPNSDSIVKMAIAIPRSPTRLTTNALRPAAAAEGLCCQKEISR